MRLCIPIIGPSNPEIAQQLQRAAELTDLVELRLDLFDALDPDVWKFPGERIFKCRNQEHLAVAQGADYLDLELSLANRAPAGVPLIISHHNFASTPTNLDAAFAQVHKLATHARSTLDALRLAVAAKRHSGIGIAMGEDGVCSRLLAPLIGSPWTYAALDEESASAPGQLTWKTLHETFELHRKTRDTQLFGLLGDPVSKSQGHIRHNAYFQAREIDAIYIPFRLRPEELGEALPLLEQLGLVGLSITMPLKEAIVEHLDVVETDSGAVNTVTMSDGKRIGTNTDGPAVLDAIGAVKGKRVVILGAGGAARAIAFDAKKRGAEVTILNRTRARARALAADIGGTAGALSDVKPCDILIQATSIGMQSDEEPPFFGSPETVLDVVNRASTPWLKRAAAYGCHTIPGTEMWQRQADLQYLAWGIS